MGKGKVGKQGNEWLSAKGFQAKESIAGRVKDVVMLEKCSLQLLWRQWHLTLG